MTIAGLPPEVAGLLGTDRAQVVVERARALRELADSVPATTKWVAHMPVKLHATTRQDAAAEFKAHLRRCDPDFLGLAIVVTGLDGRWFGTASEDFQPSKHRNTDEQVEFLFFDLHARLGAWWLTHVWRAADLGDATESMLASWAVLPAAACARALLEGVAAFVVEGEDLLEAWSQLKRRGIPSVKEVREFRDQFLVKLGQAQLATRMGERSGKTSRTKRTNILTFLEKFARGLGDESERFWDAYEWLCDAVHPSWGFSTRYTTD